MKILTPANDPTQQILVDDDVYIWASKLRWSTLFSGGQVIHNNTVKGKPIKRSLPREVMGNPKGLVVDHINHDRLDNRRENLRVCTHGQNMMNRSINKTMKGKSQYKGVTWFKPTQKWKGTITCRGKSIHLGYFTDEKHAALMYNQAAEELFGEFAFLNKI